MTFDLPRYRFPAALLLLALAMPAAVAADVPPDAPASPQAPTAAAPPPIPPALPANFAERPEVQRFVDTLVAKHGFDKAALLELFRQARFEPDVLKAILPPPTPATRSWQSYRARFIETRRIRKGLEFWQAHDTALRRATQTYGVPAEIIVAIIGIETFYGQNTGRYQTFSALATLAFDYPPRADLFRRELEELLLLARERKTDPLAYTGSFAGALGLPQFLPSSLRRYAVDFDSDGAIDLTGDADDAIGSVANFLSEHGWQKGGAVALPARIKGSAYTELADGRVDPQYTPSDLAAHGIKASRPLAADVKVALIDLATPDKPTEYWLGFQNFYTITRYNRSSFYAMSVFQLGEKLRTGDTRGYKRVKRAKVKARRKHRP